MADNGNGNILTEGKLGRLLGWASLVVALGAQAGVIVNRVDNLSILLDKIVTTIQAEQLFRVRDTIKIDDLERRIERLVNKNN